MLCLRIHIRAGWVELHQAHFVHSDVRDVNMMVRKDGKPGFMLVDFDWAEVIDKVRYPANVNLNLKVDPGGVSLVLSSHCLVDGMPIKPEPCWRTYKADVVPLSGERDIREHVEWRASCFIATR
jgi:hypothetical protein